eukprot:scaffold1669_cov129-Cylindrotheca_fusiformis.AAC.43
MQPLCRLASAGTRLSPAAYSQRLSSVARVETRSELSEEIAKDIVRHGKGDGVVTLNVGGKEFKTLRSTLHVNPVLRDRVLKAEGNNELADGAIFIDRDPAQFGLILAHLRNVADSISMMSSRKKAAVSRLFSNEVKNEVNIQIPKDHAKMRDLFVEARYFKIKELQDVLCSYDIFTWVASMLGGQGSANPFHVAAQSLQFARRALLTTGGVGILVGSQNDSLVDNIQNSIGNFLRIITGASPKAE